jgi:DNA (cytosine-5)-methyltransferase 1
MMTVGSLFAGIGGFDLGFERAGYRIAFQVEIDPFARAVLTKHWPEVPKFDDIRSVSATTLPRVDVLCGGFPCQDISLAGKGAGIDGSRSGLWKEYARLIGELRPRYVVVENVAALRSRGLGTVLGDLAACGYDAEWDCIPASAVGAPHRRDRLWLVAYPQFRGRHGLHERIESGYVATNTARCGADGTDRPAASRDGCGVQGEGTWCGPHVAHPLHHGREERAVPEGQRRQAVSDAAGGGEAREDVAHAHHPRLEGRLLHREGASELLARARGRAIASQWGTEPHVGRVAHGVPARVDRLRGLGNAIVPHIAEWIAHRILDAEARINEGAVA